MARSLVRLVFISCMAVVIAALAVPITAQAQPLVINAGQQFCPTSSFSAGGITIASGQCYMLATVNNGNGTYLAFLPPSTRIAAGQVIQLNTPGAAAILTPQVPLIPITLASSMTIPANSLELVPVSVDLAAARPMIMLTGGPAAKTIVGITTTATVPAPAAPVTVAPAPAGAPSATVTSTVTTLTPGQAYCPAADLMVGTMVIPGGRCYMLATAHTMKGTFLVFLPQNAAIGPGQLVLINDTGAPLLSSNVPMVPIAVSSVNTLLNMPLDTVTLVPVRVDPTGAQPTITLTGGAAANTVVVFTSRPHQ